MLWGLEQLRTAQNVLNVHSCDFVWPEIQVGHRMNYEDLHACRWARHFEQHIGTSLDVCGLLRARDFQNAWIHPLKDQVVKAEIDRHLIIYNIIYRYI